MTKNRSGLLSCSALALLFCAALVTALSAAGCGSTSDVNSDGGDVQNDPPCSCTPGDRRCQGTGIQVCEMTSSTCASWGPVVACATGMCNGGSCGADCKDACTAGASRCASSTNRQLCRITGSGCLDWVQESCPGQQYCDQNQCTDSVPCAVTCPSGYTCQPNGVCGGGNPSALVLNVQTVRFSGSITLNGSAPALNTAECSSSVNADALKAAVRLTETTKGYSFYAYASNCKSSAFAFSATIYPGTYKVTVQGFSNQNYPYGPLTALPTEEYVIDPALVIAADVTGKNLDVKTLKLTGSITLNGAAPTLSSSECSTTVNADALKASVRFVETKKGYTFYAYTPACRSGSFAIAGTLFPGTYQVTVSGYSNQNYPYGPLTALPTQDYVVDPALTISGDVAGKVFDVKTLKVAGSITLNGATPALNTAECSGAVNADALKASVKFVEPSKGYTFYAYTPACKSAAFTFSETIFPGTYRVTVQGNSNQNYPYGPLTELPQQEYVIDPAMVISADVAGKVLNVNTVKLAGSITLNGATPMLNKPECSTTVNSEALKASVKFVEPSKGYTFYIYTPACKSTSFAVSGVIFPGTYQVTVQGYSNQNYPYGPLTELPAQDYIVDPAMVVSADVSGKVFDAKTRTISGTITLNGAVPALNSLECSNTVNADALKASVQFMETTKGYSFYAYTSGCKSGSFAFSETIYPGTYKVTVQGYSNQNYPYGPLTELPTQSYIADPALVVTADVSGKTLNVKTLKIAGSITLNGATPMLNNAECSTTMNAEAAKGSVRFVETTLGYTFDAPTPPCRSADFTFSQTLFPGTYRIWVQGYTNQNYPYGPLTSLPTQSFIAADRLALP